MRDTLTRCTAVRLLLGSVLLTLVWSMGQAAVLAQTPIKENQQCLTCHTNPDVTVEFPDGSTRYAHVSSTAYNASVHGQEAMTCSGCHPDHEDYPHPEITAAGNREYTLMMNETCLECHPDQAEKVVDSTHARALEEGNIEAAVCVDCHGAHDTLSLYEARIEIAVTCRQCHAQIYDEYAESAHGGALLHDENIDVPTCVECHGVHSIQDPQTAQFRLQSPQLCADCHADEQLMAQYDISTDVFETYVADFHGSTVTLFQKQSPDAATNKAVCYDCHGVHAILPMDHPEAIASNKENLLKTCQNCHPDATTNFPDSWTSHYQPTFEDQPLVSIVNLFYLIVIPATIGGMSIFVATDAGRKIIDRGKDKSKQPPPDNKPKASAPPNQSNPNAEDAA